jgi:hypothetical protein
MRRRSGICQRKSSHPGSPPRYPPAVTVKLTWEQGLAWRMRRHFLDPVGDRPVPEVVRRLCGVQAQVASSAELAVRVRRKSSKPGEVARALGDGRLIKTWAMRGTLHLLNPEDGGALLSLMASGRSWERPSWQKYFGVTPKHIEALRRAASEALDGSTLTREELITAITAKRGLGHVGQALRSGWGTLLKPLAWQGDLCFGPSQGNRVTFRRPVDASTRWAGLPDPEEAAPVAIVAYLGAYGPATSESFGTWLSGGWFGKRQLRAWFAGLGDRLAEVEIEGTRAYVLAADVDELAATKPSRTVRLLGGFDQFVLGPGTGDGHVVPANRRAAVSKQSGWIAPVVVVGGRVSGTWGFERDVLSVTWFREAGQMPRHALQDEVGRLSSILDRELQLKVSLS